MPSDVLLPQAGPPQRNQPPQWVRGGGPSFFLQLTDVTRVKTTNKQSISLRTLGISRHLLAVGRAKANPALSFGQLNTNHPLGVRLSCSTVFDKTP